MLADKVERDPCCFQATPSSLSFVDQCRRTHHTSPNTHQTSDHILFPLTLYIILVSGWAVGNKLWHYQPFRYKCAYLRRKMSSWVIWACLGVHWEVCIMQRAVWNSTRKALGDFYADERPPASRDPKMIDCSWQYFLQHSRIKITSWLIVTGWLFIHTGAKTRLEQNSNSFITYYK